MVAFTLQQKTDIVAGPAYRVTNQVTSTDGSDVHVYVYRSAGQAFDHYATAADMEQWPATLAMAQVMGAAFYRLDQLTRTWPTLQLRDLDLSESSRRLQSLADELVALRSPIVGVQVVEIVGA